MQTVIKRRRQNNGAVSYTPTPIKQNKGGLIYSQGFLNNIGATTTTPISISLSSSGRMLLGITVVPITGLLTTLANTQITFIVNNLNLLLAVAANGLNPNFVQGMVFYPINQPLQGTDQISMSVINGGGATAIITTVFYVPAG